MGKFDQKRKVLKQNVTFNIRKYDAFRSSGRPKSDSIKLTSMSLEVRSKRLYNASDPQ